jgi:ectoine hydroxylase-related dioxygenase (phytanoyl-CoA dioxygenase family)
MTLSHGLHRSAAFRSNADLDLDAFRALCEQEVDPGLVPNAAAIVQSVPIYDAAVLRAATASAEDRRAMMAELNDCLLEGPGVFAIDGMMDPEVVDRASDVYSRIIEKEKAAGLWTGDHFAKPGTNDRIWNSFQKLAEESPEVYVEYFANAVFDMVCESWLGPGYRMTAQVNVVHPGGDAQRPHRDYHLGFLTDDDAARYPIGMHKASTFLTLQGAVSHSEMSIESGPTRLLPFSHQYDLGFMAYRDQGFADYFAEHFVQVPLGRGDGLFFNHALFHAAGDNRTNDISRMANLVQVSSAFGKPMETINTTKVIELCYPLMQALHREQGFSRDVEALLTMSAEGYPFPANIDITPPKGGLAPDSQLVLLRQALTEDWSPDRLGEALDQYLLDRRA